MYSSPQWALPFAAHCRSRLKLNDALLGLAAARTAATRFWKADVAFRARVGWHPGYWVHRGARVRA